MTPLSAVLAAIVFYIPNQLHFPQSFGVPGLNVLNTLLLAAFGLLLAAHYKAPPPAPVRNRILFLFVMLTWAFIVGVLGDNATAYDDFVVLKTSIFYVLLYFFFRHALQDMRAVRIVFAAILFTTAVASAEAFWEALDYGLGVYGETKRSSGPFGIDYRDANRAAVYYVIFTPLFIAVAAYYRRSSLLRLIALGGAALGIAAIFFTYSRQAYFIIAVAVMYMMVRRNWLLALATALVLVNYAQWAPQGVIDRIEMTQQDEGTASASHHSSSLATGHYDESTESRFVQWEAAGRLIADHPWGIGLNHFKREIGGAGGIAGLDAHNVYVLTATEGSVLSPIAILLVMAGLFSAGLRVQQRDYSDEARMLSVGFTAAVISVVLGNVYGSRFFDGDVMGNFWILAALVTRYAELRRDERAVSAVSP